VVLDGKKLNALERSGIHAVYIDDELGAGIEIPQALSDEIRATATEALDVAFKKVLDGRSDDMHGVTNDTAVQLTEIAQKIADQIALCGDAIYALQDLGSADSYALQHSIDVTAVGLMIGRRLLLDTGWIDHKGERRFDRLDRRLVQLGLGLMLHDIGKLIVPIEVLQKQGELNEEEWELMRRHPLAGLDLLSSGAISPLARVAVRSHHERWNGAGYPDGTSGMSIHQFARIAAVADTYDAITSERPHKAAQEPHAGWQVIADGEGSEFDPEVVSAFKNVVAPYPPGSEIVLADGRRGVVVELPARKLDQPRIRIGWDADGRSVTPYEIDLVELPSPPARAA
jgi:HD-GYP domain-containing protein (c-di-GMP phosphodiesterase class II)